MKQKRILCFGDSLTFGHDPQTCGRLPENGRWPTVMQKRLGEGYKVIEEGQPGRTIATDDPAEGEKNGLRYIGPCLESHIPLDLVIIMLGTNDCKDKFAYSAMDIAGEMQILLEKVLSYNRFRAEDHLKIMLICPPAISEDISRGFFGDIFDYHRAERIFRKLPDRYEELSKRYGCYYMDASKYASVSSFDGLHLDAENQKKLGEAVAAYVLEAFGRETL